MKTKKILNVIIFTVILYIFIFVDHSIAESGLIAYDMERNSSIKIDSTEYKAIPTNRTEHVIVFGRYGFAVREQPVKEKILLGKARQLRTVPALVEAYSPPEGTYSKEKRGILGLVQVRVPDLNW